MIRKFFLADDDEDDTSLFAEALMGIDSAIQFYSANNGRELLEKLKSGKEEPQVIFLDINMPVMNGWQFLTALAEDPRLAGIPVIVLTAADDPSQSAPRPPTVLIKPVAMDALASAISAAASRGPSSPSVI